MAREIRDPAVAAAVGKCVVARMRGFPKPRGGPGGDVYTFHEAECRFCGVSVDYCCAALEEYHRWTGEKVYSEATDQWYWNPDWMPRMEVRWFLEMTREEQAMAVKEAAKKRESVGAVSEGAGAPETPGSEGDLGGWDGPVERPVRRQRGSAPNPRTYLGGPSDREAVAPEQIALDIPIPVGNHG